MLWASLTLPTVSALICAQSATHSSQMKTQLSGERHARAASFNEAPHVVLPFTAERTRQLVRRSG
jgi:hypothetical protein